MLLSIIQSLFSKRILFLLLLILFLILSNWWSHLKVQKLEERISSYKSIRESSRKGESFKDSNGKWHYKTRPIIISDNKVLKELSKTDSNLIYLAREIKGLKKNLSNLKSASFIHSSTINKIETHVRDSVVIVNDTVKVFYQKFEYSTPWTEKKGEIVNGKLSLIEVNYDTVVVSTYWKRKWFLGKKHFYSEAFTRNPNTRIFNVYNILKEREK